MDPDAVFLYALYAPSTADLSKIDAKPFMIDGHPLAQRDELVQHYQLVEKKKLLLERSALAPSAPPESGGLSTVLLGIGLVASDPAERMRLARGATPAAAP